jgi:hypothetical protein
MSTTCQSGSGATSDELVSDADYVQLRRLVTEHAWRTGNGRSDTLHELYLDDGELHLGSGVDASSGTPSANGVGNSLRTRPGTPFPTCAPTCVS